MDPEKYKRAKKTALENIFRIDLLIKRISFNSKKELTQTTTIPKTHKKLIEEWDFYKIKEVD